MPFFVYILYSTLKYRFYVGYTGDELSERLRKHHSKHKGYTGGVGDWKIVYTESFETVEEARAREVQIKKWKSRKKIQELLSKN
ncbi:MAG: GIY-YIG nuclease family protein [Chitinophagaceae bacterium]|nr:GIY-YIG nuclease family protein [Chitinophagaceae bacterium]